MEDHADASAGYSHVLADDGHRTSMATTDSRDISGLPPTEPNMSMTNFNTSGGGGGMVYTSPVNDIVGYPLMEVSSYRSNQNVQPPEHPGSPLMHTQSNQSHSVGQQQALGLSGSGVVGIGGPRTEDGRSMYADSYRSGRSRDGQQPPALPQQFQQHPSPFPPAFRRQDSHLSQRSATSLQSHRSFTKQPTPHQQVMYADTGASGSQRGFQPEYSSPPQQHPPSPQPQYNPSAPRRDSDTIGGAF